MKCPDGGNFFRIMVIFGFDNEILKSMITIASKELLTELLIISDFFSFARKLKVSLMKQKT